MTDRAPSLGDDATKIRGAAATGRSNRALAAAPGLQLPHSECQATLLPLFDLSTAHISFLRQLTLLSFLAHRDIVYRLSLSPLTCKVAASSAAASLARTLERLLNKGAALSISPARAAKNPELPADKQHLTSVITLQPTTQHKMEYENDQRGYDGLSEHSCATASFANTDA